MNDGVTVRWTSVNTDPSTFAVHLVNNNVFPPVDHMVANSVQTSDGSFTIRGMSGVKNGYACLPNRQKMATRGCEG